MPAWIRHRNGYEPAFVNPTVNCCAPKRSPEFVNVEPSYVGPPLGATAAGLSCGAPLTGTMNGGGSWPAGNVTVWNSPERTVHGTESPTSTVRSLGRNALTWTAWLRVEAPAAACHPTGSAASAAG